MEQPEMTREEIIEKIAELKTRRDEIHQELVGQRAKLARLNKHIASLQKVRAALRKKLD